MEIKLRRDRPGIKLTARVAILTVLMLIAIVLAAILPFRIGKNNSDDIVSSVNYSSRFYHYTGFDHSDTDAFLKVSWRENTVKLKDNKAELDLHTIIYPITLENKKVTFSSSNEDIATIDENGKITAKKPGSVSFTVVLDYNGEKAECNLNVIQPVTGIFMPKSTVNVNISDSILHLDPTVYPQDATNKTLTWSSADTKIAQVDQNGNVRPTGIGMTEISAVTQDGNFIGKCFVNVINKTINVESVAIQNKDSIKLDAGQSMNMIATVSPSNAKNKTLTWTSSNKDVASISKTGKVKASKEGKTTITATSVNGKTDSFELTVGKASSSGSLDLYAKTTSNEQIPTDILGSTYVTTGTSSQRTGSGGVNYVSYSMTLAAMVKLQMSLSPPPKVDGGNGYATELQVMQTVNPETYCSGPYKFQFLDLSYSNGVDAATLNDFLKDKGVLAGQGQAFVDAAQAYNISEVYLVAHACLETGNGTSVLSRGVSVNGTTVYNMFGIGAYDSGAVSYGSQRAYSEGWTSVAAAIKGGAKWISDNYVNNSENRQNTLYKMRWNPENPTQHQYATDCEWAISQASNIQKIFNSFPNAVLTYEVPVYSGQTAVTIE